MKHLPALLGKAVLFLASMAIITGISLFVIGGYLTTWPLLRLSPRARRVQALVGAGAAAMALVQAYTGREEETRDSA